MPISSVGASGSWQIQKLTTQAKLTRAEARYDTDGDGVLSPAEKAAMTAALAARKTTSASPAKRAAPADSGGPRAAESEASAAATQVTRPSDGGARGKSFDVSV
ncbi:MAG: hypothetical protein LBU36_02720 [Clostridiales bacterium]|nr:hypothetical protein [Clostridiales bacterium]